MILKKYLPNASSIACGCMGLGGGWNSDPLTDRHRQQAHHFIDAALESGITLFDHADIYTFGKAERVFGEVLAERPQLREQILLQSKCGIRFSDDLGPKRYDLSKMWIISSVENILKRLQSDYLDILTLHRPDPLMEPDEVAEAFDYLHSQGMVHYFGVSNLNTAQVVFLKKSLRQPLVLNQMEISLSHLDFINDGVEVNASTHSQSHFATGLIEHCRLHDMQLQAWGCLSQGLFTGKDVSDQPERIQKTAALVRELAEELSVSLEAVVLAWIQRHPAAIQPVIGTTAPERIRASAQAMGLSLSREQWYRICVTARGDVP